MLGTRDSAEERRGWVLCPRTLAWVEAGRSQDRGMRMDTRAKALLSQVLFLPGITGFQTPNLQSRQVSFPLHSQQSSTLIGGLG